MMFSEKKYFFNQQAKNKKKYLFITCLYLRQVGVPDVAEVPFVQMKVKVVHTW